MTRYTDLYSLQKTVTVSEFLFHRLGQLGVQTIFGLTGEFNMPLIDGVYSVPNCRWAGNINELNAAYAADGYSRLKGLGCLVTTFGVGELSALNGIAGSFSENVAILHVVGMPPTSIQKSKLMAHHNLGNGDYDVFHRLASDVSCYSVVVSHPDVCVMEIDKCIKEAWINQKPVYLGMPVNLVNCKISSEYLNCPINFEQPQNNPEVDDTVVDHILKMIYNAKNPAIVADACVMRKNIEDETRQFCEITKFPYFVTPMGKGSVAETHERFVGVYSGTLSSPYVREIIDFSDLTIVVGCLSDEFRTSSFLFSYKSKNVILLMPTYIKLKNGLYPDVQIKPFLQALIAKFDATKVTYKFNKLPTMVIPKIELQNDVLLRQEWIWNELSHWFEEGDIVITETGSSAFGINQTQFPKNAKGMSQILWGSTGYSIGACLGALFASQELARFQSGQSHRVLLFLGDGAFQLTMQEISIMIKWELTPYIFIMNNRGYSVDRFLHHRSNAAYYDIQQWDYLGLLQVFGATNYQAEKILNVGNLQAVLNAPHFAKNNKIRMLELMLPPTDVPGSLIEQWKREQEEQKKRYHDSTTTQNRNKRLKTESPASVSSSSTSSSWMHDF